MIDAAVPAFMSTVPRPWSRPWEISPDQGERGQSEPSPTGKTSMCPFMISRGPLGVPHVKSLTMFGMDGWGAMISGVMP